MKIIFSMLLGLALYGGYFFIPTVSAGCWEKKDSNHIKCPSGSVYRIEIGSDGKYHVSGGNQIGTSGGFKTFEKAANYACSC